MIALTGIVIPCVASRTETWIILRMGECDLLTIVAMTRDTSYTAIMIVCEVTDERIRMREIDRRPPSRGMTNVTLLRGVKML